MLLYSNEKGNVWLVLALLVIFFVLVGLAVYNMILVPNSNGHLSPLRLPFGL